MTSTVLITEAVTSVIFEAREYSPDGKVSSAEVADMACDMLFAELWPDSEPEEFEVSNLWTQLDREARERLGTVGDSERR